MNSHVCVIFVLITPTPKLRLRMDKISREVKHNAISLGNRGLTQIEIKEVLGISVSTIQRAKYKLRDHGDIEGGTKKRGRKAKLCPRLEEVMLLRQRG